MPTWLFIWPLIELHPQKLVAKKPSRAAASCDQARMAIPAVTSRNDGPNKNPFDGKRIASKFPMEPETAANGEMRELETTSQTECERCGRLATGRICRKSISAKTGRNCRVQRLFGIESRKS